MPAKKSNVQAAAKRRVVAMDFKSGAKLDTSQVRDVRKNSLQNLLDPRGSNHSKSNGFAPYRYKKRFKRNDQA